MKFSVLENPWIDTDVGTLSLRDVLLRAHEIRALSDPFAPTNVAVLRLMMVVVRRALRGPCDEDGWKALWDNGRFPEKETAAYLERWAERFELFGEGRFYQQVPFKKTKKTVTYLAPMLATESNILHFNHSVNAESGLCPVCISKGLIELPAFCPSGGSGLKPGINKTPPVYFSVKGENLFQSVLLNSIPHNWDDGDVPRWEGTPRNGPKIGFCDGLTWQPRTTRLDDPVSGNCLKCGSFEWGVVRQINFDAGRSRPENSIWEDPHVALSNAVKSAQISPPNPQSDAQSFAKFWRKQAAILVGSGDKKGLPPPVLGFVETLLRRGFSTPPLAVEVIALHTEPGQAKYFFTTHETWPLPKELVLDATIRDRAVRLLELLESKVTEKNDQFKSPVSPKATKLIRASHVNSSCAENEKSAKEIFRKWLENPELSSAELGLSSGYVTEQPARANTSNGSADSSACREFVDALADLEPSDLSVLREGLAASCLSYPKAFDLFTPIFWDVRKDLPPSSREACWNVATFFPLNPLKGGERHGADLATLVRRDLARRVVNDEARLRLIRRWDDALEAGLPELRHHLPFFLRQLRRLEVPIDWPGLLRDLIEWKQPGQPVQTRWRQNGPSAPRVQSFKAPTQKENKHARRNSSVAESQSVESES